MNNVKYILLIAIVLFSSCKTKIQKTSDALIIHTEDSVTKSVRIHVVNENIIHVSASPEKNIPDFNSLVVDQNQNSFTDWTYKKDNDQVTVSTKNIIAEVSLKTGEIVFKDSTGTIKLKEKTGGGKSFNPVTIDEKPFYSVRQIFESPADEAFYGLGAHQNRQMNYKGEDVELAQHNLVDINPFLISNKNYGILWDNYSITRFGDPREFQPISSLQLYSKDGEPGGITAEYFNDGKLVLTQTEDTLDYTYLESQVRWPSVVRKNDAKVIWEGSISSPVAGNHKFRLYSSEYLKLWIDGNLIFDKWRQNWNPWYNKFNVNMAANEKHTIKIEWIPNGGYIGLEHLDPLPDEEQQSLSLFSEVATLIDFYYISGNSTDEIISGYRSISGKAPIMPKWAMGFWQSRERYKTQDEIINTMKEFRKRNIPIDNIVLDWFYWEEDKWGSHKFDTSRFADAEGMITTLHDDLNAQIMISVWPKFYPGTDNFNEMQEAGYLYQRNLELERKDWVGPGYVSTFYDAFNPGARKLFWSQINKNLNSKGIDAWWLDATEPDLESNHSIEERKNMINPTYLGPGAQYFNPFSLMNAKAIYEGSREDNPDKRVFILTRSAFAGQQKYAAAVWSGDVASRWSDLGDQISAGINFCMAGIPYWTHDIGGFSLENRFVNPQGKDLDEWRELNTRWFQFGAFCPLFRSHGQFPYREMFNIAPENHKTYQSMLYYDKLRYRLMPYIYSLAGHSFHNDYTIMRGLVMDFPTDRKVYEITDQYMFGPALLVNPVHEYKATSREVYLPSSFGWYELNSGKYLNGGNTIVADAPMEKIPVFVKEGSVIVMGEEIEYVDQKPADNLYIYIYGGKDGKFDLYEDDGVTYNYEKGKYSTISFTYNNEKGELTISEPQGEFPEMLKERNLNVVLITQDKPVGIDDENIAFKQLKYEGKQISVVLK